jgi:soluble lytic murein transglycosylase-like protein
MFSTRREARLQRKLADYAVFTPILSHLRQLGRGSNTFCVSAFALSLVNLSSLGPAASPAPIQPPALQAPAPTLPTAAPVTPPKPVETIAPTQSLAATPAPTTPPITATVTAPAKVETRIEPPAPKPAAQIPHPPPPSDDVERLRKAADLLVKVNEALGVPQSPYGKIIYDIAIRHSINPHLVAALIHVESAFNARAVSPMGAYGLMQLLPETARRFGLTRKKDLFNPKKNLEAGVRYLKWLTDRFNGDAQKILAAYNAGEGAVDKFGGIPPYQETQSYVQKIFGLLGVTFTPAPVPQPIAAAPDPKETIAAR